MPRRRLTTVAQVTFSCPPNRRGRLGPRPSRWPALLEPGAELGDAGACRSVWSLRQHLVRIAGARWRQCPMTSVAMPNWACNFRTNASTAWIWAGREDLLIGPQRRVTVGRLHDLVPIATWLSPMACRHDVRQDERVDDAGLVDDEVGARPGQLTPVGRVDGETRSHWLPGVRLGEVQDDHLGVQRPGINPIVTLGVCRHLVLALLRVGNPRVNDAKDSRDGGRRRRAADGPR